jgi:hypothetical protein
MIRHAEGPPMPKPQALETAAMNKLIWPDVLAEPIQRCNKGLMAAAILAAALSAAWVGSVMVQAAANDPESDAALSTPPTSG